MYCIRIAVLVFSVLLFVSSSYSESTSNTQHLKNKPESIKEEQEANNNSSKPNQDDTGGRKLDIVDISGSFFSSNKLGKLFVIKGKVINNYPQSRSHILLKATIEDDKMRPLDRKLGYAGNTFTEQELKSITKKEIEKRLSRKSGNNNSNIDVAPGEAVPFMIIFYDLPDSMNAYAVETYSSSPSN